MQKMKLTPGRGTSKGRYNHFSTDTGTSDALEIPNTGSDILVMAKPGDGGTVTIEYSISSLDRIADGNGLWEAWGPGDVSEQSSGAITAGITAVRAVATGAAADWEVTA